MQLRTACGTRYLSLAVRTHHHRVNCLRLLCFFSKFMFVRHLTVEFQAVVYCGQPLSPDFLRRSYSNSVESRMARTAPKEGGVQESCFFFQSSSVICQISACPGASHSLLGVVVPQPVRSDHVCIMHGHPEEVSHFTAEVLVPDIFPELCFILVRFW
ncbi:hypothetical protein AcW1_003714 [Taiwanofungus camphoratus]|nr:hypothetical protein AcW1_003714 [Antrodia cinnamomea]